jgi:hypothetical protein
MFKNEKQRIEAVRALLRTLFSERQVQGWWDDSGPTEVACNILAKNGGYLSHGEAILFRAAFDFWNGSGKVTLDEIIHTLDHKRVRAVCGLITALNKGAVDVWIYRRQIEQQVSDDA